MTTSVLILSLLVGGAATALYLFWHASNRRGYKMRNEKISAQKRSSRSVDRRPLSKQEQVAVNKANALAANGQIRPAALLLEQTGLYRECIAVLEDAGYIDDAAGVLIKMQRPNRAGFIFARHGRWMQAAECFKVANLPAEVGKCLREAERYQEAADFFLQAGRLEDAGGCLAHVGQWQAAGRMYLKVNQLDKAKIAYDKLFALNKNTAGQTFESNELEYFRGLLSRGDLLEGYIDALARNESLSSTIKILLAQGQIKVAGSLYAKSVADIGPMLMSEVNLMSPEARHLAEMFMAVNHYRYAGMVYEQITDYRLAAQAFEEAEDWDRASYCYDRSGDKLKAAAVKKREPQQSIAPAPNNHTFDFDSSDKTAVIDLSTPTNLPLPDIQPSPSKHLHLATPPAPPIGMGAGVFAIDPHSQGHAISVDEDRLLFHKCSLFQDLDFAQRTTIWNIGVVETVAEGEVLVEWGDDPSGLYFILSGEMDCHLKTDSGAVTLDSIHVGDLFGEIWLLAEQPASVKFVGKTSSRLLFLERAKFIEILEGDGVIARKVYKHFTHRLLAKMLNPSKPQDIRHAS